MALEEYLPGCRVNPGGCPALKLLPGVAFYKAHESDENDVYNSPQRLPEQQFLIRQKAPIFQSLPF